MSVWIRDCHPVYEVISPGYKVIDTMVMKSGYPPLTWAQQKEVADYYAEFLTWEVEH